MSAPSTRAATAIAKRSGTSSWLQDTTLQLGLPGGHPIAVLMHVVGSHKKRASDSDRDDGNGDQDVNAAHVLSIAPHAQERGQP
jgi:hypothetical protein